MKFNNVSRHVVCGKVTRAPMFIQKSRSYWLRANTHSFRYCSCRPGRFPYQLRLTPSRSRTYRLRRRPCPCFGCGVNTVESMEYYMVHDRVWDKAFGANRKGYSCIGCLEQALKRRLCRVDFTFFPVNTDPNRKRSNRLQDRLGVAKIYK